MTYYRLYTRNGSIAGHFIGVQEIDAPNDNAAMRIAAQNHEKFLELWQEERRVEAFEPDRSKVELAAA